MTLEREFDRLKKKWDKNNAILKRLYYAEKQLRDSINKWDKEHKGSSLNDNPQYAPNDILAWIEYVWTGENKVGL